MDYLILKEFLSSYSLPSVIIAAAVSISYLFILKFIGKNLKNAVKIQLPFLTSVALYFIYDMIFVAKSFVFRDGAFIAGVLSGSLSVIFSSIIKKIRRGEAPSLSSKTAILIEGLLEGVIPPTQLAATAIAVEKLLEEIENGCENDLESTRQSIQELIAEHVEDNVTEIELYSLSKLIVQSATAV